MKRRDTIGMLGSDGFGENMFCEREATPQGQRVAMYRHQSMRLVKEVLEPDPVKARDTLRRFAHEAIDAMFEGGKL